MFFCPFFQRYFSLTVYRLVVGFGGVFVMAGSWVLRRLFMGRMNVSLLFVGECKKCLQVESLMMRRRVKGGVRFRSFCNVNPRVVVLYVIVFFVFGPKLLGELTPGRDYKLLGYATRRRLGDCFVVFCQGYGFAYCVALFISWFCGAAASVGIQVLLRGIMLLFWSVKGRGIVHVARYGVN